MFKAGVERAGEQDGALGRGGFLELGACPSGPLRHQGAARLVLTLAGPGGGAATRPPAARGPGASTRSSAAAAA